ncbi:ArsR/SmtB family transcription factor [Rugamonas sp. CCM 8940]|uniref:ArsR/SmtB family transcription factor n=1 Tax=Rugamonas sp. CCM 8940 TaxID=2765359 RepID=UPI0018F46679|nr:metalloregulator ArsR/SmtB family transcription factor [Rugamonas sp. CCM 8940]MBJ7310921.1 helix-turn-helix transcriptional regulator [Rugamonas sp. CCM 8940]
MPAATSAAPRGGAGDPAADLPAPAPSLAPVFAALGDPVRLKLVRELCAGGAYSIAHLTQNTAISRQGVTKHLGVLAEAGIVRDVKIGRERLWQLEPARIDEAKRSLESIARKWEQALARIKSFVEKND